MEKDILDMELSEEEATKLAEEIQTWKEEFSAKLEAEAEQKIQDKINELDEQNNAWKEEVAEAYSEKFLAALDEMREDVRAEVLAESVKTDPVHKVVDEICRLVAPLMNEEYVENTYKSEMEKLVDKLAAFEKKEALAEGAATLEELIENYDESLKPMLRALIGEGTADEVTAKYTTIVESLNDANETVSEDDEEDDDFDFDFDEDEEAEEESEDEVEEEEVEEVSTIVEEFEDDQDTPKKNSLRESMMRLY